MAWQDIIIAGGQWIFLLALLPSIFGKDKPALTTSILTSVVLAILAFSYATLSLWISTISAMLVSSAWLTLAVQKYRINRHKKMYRSDD
jgi:hypothetical protein